MDLLAEGLETMEEVLNKTGMQIDHHRRTIWLQLGMTARGIDVSQEEHKIDTLDVEVEEYER